MGILLTATISLSAARILIPMDNTQKNHLRAYGLTYKVLKAGHKARWLLNYRAGSFLVPDTAAVRKAAVVYGVTVQSVSENGYALIRQQIDGENMNDLLLEKAPRLAVYAPESNDPWDDAVTLVLHYAKIPYTKLYDKEVLAGRLAEFDWLHMHHEDFTGQYGKFYGFYRRASWYLKKVQQFRTAARTAGYPSVAAHKLAVAKAIKKYVAAGGFLFAMCSATETFDIALAAEGIDIIPRQIDGTPITPGAQQKLDFRRTFAFQKFEVELNAHIYAHSNIDVDVRKEGIAFKPDSFDLFQFSAKIDPVPTMLVQNHVNTVKGFLGQTTAFRKPVIKPAVTVLGHTPGTIRVKYIHGTLGKGSFSFYAGHDPEDYRHLVGDPPTNLDLYPQSPGYRLILNNVLFPVAEKKERKT